MRAKNHFRYETHRLELRHAHEQTCETVREAQGYVYIIGSWIKSGIADKGVVV